VVLWSGLVLALSVVGSALVHMLGLELAMRLQWHLLPVAMGVVFAAGLASAGLAVFAKRDGIHLQRWQAGGALLLAAALIVGHAGVVYATRLPASVAPPSDLSVSISTLQALAAIGAPCLLGLLLLGSVLEAHLKATLRRTREELQVAAQTDPLTQLPNRAMFETLLQRAAHKADRNNHRLALLFVNLDGLKTVNESFGQAIGDRVLCEMGQRLRAIVGSQDLVARAGGDEFLMLLDGNPGTDGAAHLASRLLKTVSEHCEIDGRDVSMSCSIGITMYPEHGALSKLIAHAAAAMHASKRNGGAAYSFFEAHMVAGVRDQVDLLRDLRRAVAQGELELYYQPKIHAPSGQITGAEALMRWHHPQRGMVGPNIFIPLAERFGLIHALGNWLIEDVCRQVRMWRDEGLRMRVAINLSVHQLRQDDLVERICEALQRHNLDPNLLTCEITESAAMEDTRTTLRVIERLGAAGVHLSIDDFGTGYSSLSYLRQLAAEELKIDRSFVLDLETSADARAIVDAVVKLAQALGLKVVAEGVETEAQQKILRSLGCDELQGYLFAKPMSAKSLAVWAMQADGPRSLDFRPSLFGETLPALHI
jgi:diguanylate cyclase (GGDEF)-like protein